MDRKQFKTNLENLFKFSKIIDEQDCIQSLIFQSQDMRVFHKLKMKKIQDVIDSYLSSYDNAADENEQNAVIGSVSIDESKFGVTQQEIDDEKAAEDSGNGITLNFNL